MYQISTIHCSVLKAQYTFPSHRLNDVPIALYFATHFYFITYHTFSNLILRKVRLILCIYRLWLHAQHVYNAHMCTIWLTCIYVHTYNIHANTNKNTTYNQIETTYVKSTLRSVFFWCCILAFSYFTAFMETLTISSFPYYAFESRDMVCSLHDFDTCEFTLTINMCIRTLIKIT